MPLDAARPACPILVCDQQALFDDTGAVHAAAVFDRDGDDPLVREDVGRHNAVDKVVGALLLARSICRRPAWGCSSAAGPASRWCRRRGRPGSATLVAVSAPTTLAVDAARRANLVLAGFVRGDRFNVYAPERLARPDR